MKKKLLIASGAVIAILVALVALVVPYRVKSYDDGGTRDYQALAYRVIAWKRISPDEIYEKTLRAGKSIFVYVDSGEFEDWIRNTDRIVKKFGSHSLYLHFPEMSYDQAQYLLDYAEKNWSDVKGSFFE